LLGLSPDRVVTIGAASNGRFFVPDRTETMPEESRRLLRVLGITRPFVYSVGDMDYRKNPWGLIDAFAMLPDELRGSHQLVLSYVVRGGHRGQVQQYARDRGVADQLVLTPWLSDWALRPLYQRCAAFVFPSMYEGFGLPILEAMHCGAPVVVGNNSSQIEVVGDAGLLFNVADAGELAGHLVRLLKEPERAREMGERAVVQARRFSWEATADKTLEVLARLFEEPERAREMGERAVVQARRSWEATADNGVLARSHAPEPSVGPRPGRRRAARRRIAFFSPLPPLASEVADDSARLLEELKHRYAIDLYHDAGFLPHIGLRTPEFGCYDYRLFERNARVMGYHALVYQMGDAHYHHYMYDTLLHHPGIVTLHDLGLAGFQFSYAQRPGMDGDAHIRREFEAFCGAEADRAFRAIAAGAEAPGEMPAACIERGIYLNGRILQRATAVVVHSPWCVGQVRSRFPNHVDKISVVASGATALDPSPQERSEIRARFGMPPDALIVASVGRIHPTKMNAETIAAFAPLAREIPGALLAFAGKEDDQGEARRKAMELGLRHRVRFLGHRQADVAADLAAIADIGVCLRQPPTGGETSAALMDLLRLGVPTIISDVGSFAFYPDSVVRKHRWDLHGLTGLTQALRELAEDRPRREALGRAAWHYVHQNHGWPRAADSYQEIIERTVAGQTRPQAGGHSALPGPQVVASPEWLQAAS
jgi:glycosyltransferase involved in cell wall biosynthesis